MKLSPTYALIAVTGIIALLASASFAGEDGINIDRCEDVVIEDCFVTSNDDPMCIKSGPDEAFEEAYRFDCRNISTSGCVVFNESYRALQIGAEASANFEEDILYRNIYIVKAGSGINIGLTYRYPDKSLVRNVRYENIYMERGASIILSSTYMDSGATLDGVYLKNIVSYGGCKVSLNGQPNYPVSNITFENLSINGTLVQNSTNFTIGTNVNNVRVLINDDRTGYPVALRLVNPTDNAMVLKNVPIKLQAHCYQGPQTTLQRCEFFVNGTSVGSATKAPWEVSWTPTAEGPAEITATLSAGGSKPVSTLSPVTLNVIGSAFGGVALHPPAVWLKPGSTQQFSARIVDKNGTPLPVDATIAWSGDHVNNEGLYTAPAAGATIQEQVKVQLQAGGNTYTATAQVYVSTESVQGVVLNTKPLGITSTLSDFPLLVRLSADNFPFEKAGSRPRLRITDADGVQLAHQIEQWDGAKKRATLWVRMPQINPNTTFYTVLLHWSSASDGADYDSVFSTTQGYEAVWHLGSTADVLGRHHLSPSKSTVIDNPLSGSALSMDTIFGSSFASPLSWQASQPFTVSGWMRSAALKATLIEGASTTGMQFTTPGGVGPCFAVKGDGPYYAYCKQQQLIATPGSAWNHVAVTREANGTMTYYFNGVSAQLVSATPAKAFKFDKLASTSQGSAYDEIRIERVARSGDWIRLCYETQKPAAAQDVVYDGGLDNPVTQIAPSLATASPALRQLLQPIAGGILIHPNKVMFDKTDIALYTLHGRLLYASDLQTADSRRIAATPGVYILRYHSASQTGAVSFCVR